MSTGSAPWGIIAAGGVSAALALAQFLLPVAGVLLSVFTPLPILWLVWRADPEAAGEAPERERPAAGSAWSAVAAGLLAAGLATAAAGWRLAALAAAQVVPLGVLLGLGLRRRWSVTAAVGSSVAAVLAVAVVALLVRSGLDVTAATRELEAQFETAVAIALASAAGEVVDPGQIAALFVRLLPGLAVIVTATAAWANLFALRWYAARWPNRDAAVGRVGEAEGAGGDARPAGEARLGGTGRSPLDDWSRWAAPEPLVFVLILGGAALLPGARAATTVGLNLVLVVGFVYVMQGLAIVGYFFRARRVPLVLRVAGYTMIGVQQLLLVVVAAVGLADLWVDFRRRSAPAARGIAPRDSENGGNER